MLNNGKIAKEVNSNTECHFSEHKKSVLFLGQI